MRNRVSCLFCILLAAATRPPSGICETGHCQAGTLRPAPTPLQRIRRLQADGQTASATVTAERPARHRALD